MSTLADTRPSNLAARIHRRYDIVTSGGMNGAMAAAAVLQQCGLPVRDFSVDVREGIVYSTLSCTVSMTAAEAPGFTAQLAEIPAVIAVDPA